VRYSAAAGVLRLSRIAREKREQIAVNTAGGPLVKVCHLAKAHALFAKVRSELLSRMPDCGA
jgi:hypothetical protein